MTNPMTAISEALSDEKLSKMLAGLEGATAGEWFVHARLDERQGTLVMSKVMGSDHEIIADCCQRYEIGNRQDHANAAHIARCDPDTIRAMILELQSLRSGNGGEVRVKALEWAGDEASMPFGKYRLYRTDDGWGLSFNDEELVHVGFNSVASFESPREKAMSYAQPQYRARILSALDIKP